jgi:hypothetical protein
MQKLSSLNTVVCRMLHNIYWYQNPQSSGVDTAQAGDTILQYWLSIFRKRSANDIVGT